MPLPQPSAQRRFAWVRNPILRTGLITGVFLSAVLSTWLVFANRVPSSANFAGLRNTATAALTGLLMLIPVVRFLRSPGRLLLAGLTGWTMLTCTYLIMGLSFERLYSRMGPFQVFMLGAIVYGCFAVITWVSSLVLAARHQPIATARRRSY